MTDIRRPTIAALQGSPTELQLLIANRVLCNPPCTAVLHIVARWLGLIGSEYDTSEDAGYPVQHNER